MKKLIWSLLCGVLVLITSPSYAQWSITYDYDDCDSASSICETTDGGYMVTGNNGNRANTHHSIWIMKLDTSGNIIHQKNYDGSDYDSTASIGNTTDGGYVVAGNTRSFGAGSDDAWVIRLDSSGSILWQKTYGNSNGDHARSIQQTSDGGYVVAGDTMP